MTVSDQRIEATVLDLLASRAADSSICPSDAARRLADDWRPLMEPVRRVTARLQEAGRVVVTQGGEPAGPPPWHGPVRIVRGQGFGGTPGG